MLGEFSISESPISGYQFVETNSVAVSQNIAQISVLPNISAIISVFPTDRNSISVKPSVV